MRLLDMYCGGGGAGMGYSQAGFDVVGVDLNPQENYPFEFHQSDAIDYVAQHGWEFDAIHASPPCQSFSQMSNCRPGLADTYPDLVAATRAMLDFIGKPYVLENVIGSPVRPDITLCGHMFGLPLYRHRVFESNMELAQLPHVKHTLPGSKAGHWTPGHIISVSGNCAPIALARAAMGIDWTNRHELAESIPPAYTEHIGQQLLNQMTISEAELIARMLGAA